MADKEYKKTPAGGFHAKFIGFSVELSNGKPKVSLGFDVEIGESFPKRHWERLVHSAKYGWKYKLGLINDVGVAIGDPILKSMTEEQLEDIIAQGKFSIDGKYAPCLVCIEHKEWEDKVFAQLKFVASDGPVPNTKAGNESAPCTPTAERTAERPAPMDNCPF